jgi:hypothetical protein
MGQWCADSDAAATALSAAGTASRAAAGTLPGCAAVAPAGTSTAAAAEPASPRLRFPACRQVFGWSGNGSGRRGVLGLAAAGSRVRGHREAQVAAPSGAPAPQAANESTRVVRGEIDRFHCAFLVIGKKPSGLTDDYIRMQTRAFLIDKSLGNLVG